MTDSEPTTELPRRDVAAIMKANREERIAAGLHPKQGSQSLAETRRILMTWTKADLVEFQIREESDALKAIDRAIAAEQALREHRTHSLTISKPTYRTDLPPVAHAAFEHWVLPRKGQDLTAESVFLAGYNAAINPPADLAGIDLNGDAHE